jgi:hypothetical protein
VSAKLHRAFLPRARLDETHFPRREPEQHLIPHPDLEAWIQLEMHREPNEEVHNVEREKRVSRLLPVCRDDAIVAAEIARGDAIDLQLKLVVKKCGIRERTSTKAPYDLPRL